VSGTQCVDCGVECLPDTPEGAADWQQYGVHDGVWAAAGRGRGWLCVSCLEVRLGRSLSAADLIHAEINRLGAYDDAAVARAEVAGVGAVR
jgi:hypothetical protein